MRRIVFFLLALCFGFSFKAQAQNPIKGFIFPADAMYSGWQYYRQNGTGAYRSFFYDSNHLGADIDLTEGTPIKAIANGIMKVYRLSQGYGELVAVIESQLPTPISFINGYGNSVTTTHFLHIYGHIRNSEVRGGAALLWTIGDNSNQVVNQGDVIGFVNDSSHPVDGVYPDHNGDGFEHLHLGIRLSDRNNAASVDPTAWFRGYEKATSFGTDFADPIVIFDKYLNAIPGVYSAGWLPTNHSQSFLDTYLDDGTLGRPHDNGGTVFVHYWSDPGPGNPKPGVWIQDLYNPSTGLYSAIILNPNGNAYPVKGPFRDWYTNPAHFGYKELGAPKGKEYQDGNNIVQEFENGALTRPVGSSTVSQEYLIRLAVNSMYAPIQLSATNFTVNSITFAWKDGINPSGTTYKIYRNNAYVASAGTNLYFTDSGLNPNTMYQYKVSALYNSQESIFSNTMIVGTLPSTIPSNAKGAVTVITTPSDAGIYHSGGGLWKNAPVIAESLDVGNYSMVAKRSGYADTPFDFGISPGYLTQLDVRLNPPSFPFSFEAENMTQGTGIPVSGGKKLTSTNNWYIFDWVNFPEAGRIEVEIVAKADSSVAGVWPKLYTPSGTPAQELNSTDWTSLFFYRDFTQGMSATVELQLDGQTRGVPGHSVIIDRCILRYVAVPPPSAPSSCTAAFNQSTATITWTDNSSNEQGFRIEYQFGSTSSWGSFNAPANATSYQYTAGAPYDELYRFRVKAYVASGAITSASSNETLAKTLSAQGNFTASAASSSKINLSWTDNSSLEDGFKIERKPSGGNFIEVASTVANATTFSDSVGLSASTTYFYRVRAFALSDGSTPNVSSYSGEASATTPSSVANLIMDPECNGPFTQNELEGWGWYNNAGSGTHTVSFTTTNPLSGSSSIIGYNDTAIGQGLGIKQLMNLIAGHQYRVSFLHKSENAGPFECYADVYSTVDWTSQNGWQTYMVGSQRGLVNYTFTAASTALSIIWIQFGNAIGNVRIDSVAVVDLTAPPPSNPVLAVSPTTLNLGSASTGTLSGNFNITNSGGGTLSWTLTKNGNITVSPLSGTNAGTINVSIVVDGVSLGAHLDKVFIASNGGADTVDVSYTVTQASTGNLIADPQCNGPFSQNELDGWGWYNNASSGTHTVEFTNSSPLSGASSILGYNSSAVGQNLGIKQLMDLIAGHQYKVSFLVKSDNAGPYECYADVYSTVNWTSQNGWQTYYVNNQKQVVTYTFTAASTARSIIWLQFGNVTSYVRYDSVSVTDLSLPKAAQSDVEDVSVPTSFNLYQNHPNPFNPVTTIVFDVPEKSRVLLSVYNLVGQKVAVLVDGDVEAGRHRVSWDATANPSGVYLYELKSGSFRSIRKMAVVK